MLAPVLQTKPHRSTISLFQEGRSIHHHHRIGTHSGTLALKTDNFSRKSNFGKKKKPVVLVKREKWFTKTLLSLFFQGSLVQMTILVNPFLRFTKTTDFLLKSSVWRAGVPEWLVTELGFLKRAFAQMCLRAWYQVRFLRSIFGHKGVHLVLRTIRVTSDIRRAPGSYQGLRPLLCMPFWTYDQDPLPLFSQVTCTIAFFALWPQGRAIDWQRRGATVVLS